MSSSNVGLMVWDAQWGQWALHSLYETYDDAVLRGIALGVEFALRTGLVIDTSGWGDWPVGQRGEVNDPD